MGATAGPEAMGEFNLLQMGVGARLAIAGVACALVWALTLWALA
jgi:hypothetical protein